MTPVIINNVVDEQVVLLILLPKMVTHLLPSPNAPPTFESAIVGKLKVYPFVLGKQVVSLKAITNHLQPGQ